jgi:isopenicillin N synthase-like dioxygenase
VLRLIHYPPLAQDAPPGAIRAAEHEDINLITLLPEGTSQGLEVLSRDGTWLPVVNQGDLLVVNAGDMLMRLTNGAIPSTTHRVVNPTGPNVARYSMPCEPCQVREEAALRRNLRVPPGCLPGRNY